MLIQDYILVNREGSSLQLAQVVDVENLQVVYDKNRHDPEKLEVEVIKADQIFLNLGQTPKFGTVYGVAIEPFLNQVFSDTLGEIRFYRQMQPEDKKVLRKALKTCYAELESRDCHYGLPCDWEIRNEKGKYQGSYKFKNKGNDVITLKPAMFDLEYLQHLIYHECGHLVHARQVTREYKEKWVKLYHWYTKQVRDAELLTEIRLLIEENATLKDTSGLSDDGKEVLKSCLTHFKKVHFLSPEHVELCLTDIEFLDTIFPSSLELGLIDHPIGEYGSESVDEFFAESFRLSFLGKQLPERIQELFDETLANLDKNPRESD